MKKATIMKKPKLNLTILASIIENKATKAHSTRLLQAIEPKQNVQLTPIKCDELQLDKLFAELDSN